ncbi:hypothetical protein ERO13_D11G323650v2 [Gossypium hirsutum]|uniref:Uncharacterized protein n=2 Tax=Gossypium TaxID=3633 RepID=A0A5J5PIN3_GOSBA|nr:hypothetical protein ES319_D11G359200v1 [Gossypium barbadense]KAG4123383.1 hypothetical protein ERO13_D11G323650v2 [Gossypium hirsutum]TYH47056.1 hypothetical protein ES332_D11G384700v1 [Gossypium tomentosum]
MSFLSHMKNNADSSQSIITLYMTSNLRPQICYFYCHQSKDQTMSAILNHHKPRKSIDSLIVTSLKTKPNTDYTHVLT